MRLTQVENNVGLTQVENKVRLTQGEREARLTQVESKVIVASEENKEKDQVVPRARVEDRGNTQEDQEKDIVELERKMLNKLDMLEKKLAAFQMESTCARNQAARSNKTYEEESQETRKMILTQIGVILNSKSRTF